MHTYRFTKFGLRDKDNSNSPISMWMYNWTRTQGCICDQPFNFPACCYLKLFPSTVVRECKYRTCENDMLMPVTKGRACSSARWSEERKPLSMLGTEIITRGKLIHGGKGRLLRMLMAEICMNSITTSMTRRARSCWTPEVGRSLWLGTWFKAGRKL